MINMSLSRGDLKRMWHGGQIAFWTVVLLSVGYEAHVLFTPSEPRLNGHVIDCRDTPFSPC